MTTQSRMSVAAVILVTYFIGALMWRNDPERMAGFLKSGVGQSVVTIGHAACKAWALSGFRESAR
jgi:tight adherence protein B